MKAEKDRNGRWGDRPEVELSGARAEFRVALQEEIAAARRSAASSGVPLINGRRIGKVAAAYQYAFAIQNAINAPGDQPADLHVPGRGPVEATVISVEGLAVTISVPEDLGATIAYATLRSDLTLLLRRLISRIEDLADTENPAGDRLLGFAAPSGMPVPEHATQLNEQQALAVASSLGRDTTFIWGPPGTGKTRTIGTIGEQLYRRERSVLLVSHTNAAVDQALLHIADQLADTMGEGSVLRVGDPVDQRLRKREELLAITHVKRRTDELQARKSALEREKETKTRRVLELGRLIALCEWLPEGTRDIQATRTALSDLQASERRTEETREQVAELRAGLPRVRDAAAAGERALQHRRQRAELARQLPNAAAATNSADPAPFAAGEDDARSLGERLESLWAELGALPALDVQRSAAARAHAAHDAALTAAGDAGQLLAQAQELHERASQANALQRRWRGLPKPDEQLAIVAEREAALAACESAVGTAGRDADMAQATLARIERLMGLLIIELDRALASFTASYGERTPEELIRTAADTEKQLAAGERELDERRRVDASVRDNLGNAIWRWLSALEGWGLDVRTDRRGVEQMLDELGRVRDAVAVQVAGLDVSAVRGESDALNADIRRANAEIAEIEEQMKTVEAIVIAEARVIATTLTRAYSREPVYARRYDSVILDEASMAPIPALWAAAALAEHNVVLVGDFKQLPPIKHSDHDLAEKWLGRDVFEASGVLRAYDAGTPPSHFVQLSEQFRMHPQISAIPNALIYDSTLRDGAGTNDESSLDGFYNRDWGHDAPVLMVDTGSANAWVTSVDRGGSASRMNFLSATICLDLAVRVLREERPTAKPGDHPRVLVASPYRPQARLLELMIREQGLQDEVVAGTAHTFQGSEAPIVIFDLVVDEPHWRVGLFNPDFDDTSRRLLNVALTRAQKRLVIVGDLDYARRNGKRAFLNRVLSFAIDHYPRVDAVDVVPAGLAARAASAHSGVFGGTAEPTADRMVMTQEDFDAYLPGDLAAANKRVVIYSPFMTARRLGVLETHLKAAIERRARVYVVTKAPQDRGKRDADDYRRMEHTLTAWGITVIHKPKMHEKLVFIDDRIVWAGSLNPLSFSDTQEIMTRYDSREVFADYAGAMSLDDILAVYEAGEGTCPVCGSELVPAEGRTGVYWRCIVPDCHTRSLDAPAPKDGKIVCHICGAAVEYVEMPSGPHWRCLDEKRHRQKVVPSHLRLPKMRELVEQTVGKRGIARLERQFAAARNGSADDKPRRDTRPTTDHSDQGSLFA